MSLKDDMFRASLLGALILLAADVVLIGMLFHFEIATAAALADGLLAGAPQAPDLPDLTWGWAIVGALAAPKVGKGGLSGFGQALAARRAMRASQPPMQASPHAQLRERWERPKADPKADADA